jgi:thioredoxin-related protein
MLLGAAAAAELVMFVQHACEWCEAWDADVAPVYGKTKEGRLVPLRRLDIHDPLPLDLEFIRGLIYTPTFVLVDKGMEIGRIKGYPGEDFFWGLLQQLIENCRQKIKAGQPGKPSLIRVQRPPNFTGKKDKSWPIQQRY